MNEIESTFELFNDIRNYTYEKDTISLYKSILAMHEINKSEYLHAYTNTEYEDSELIKPVMNKFNELYNSIKTEINKNRNAYNTAYESCPTKNAIELIKRCIDEDIVKKLKEYKESLKSDTEISGSLITRLIKSIFEEFIDIDDDFDISFIGINNEINRIESIIDDETNLINETIDDENEIDDTDISEFNTDAAEEDVIALDAIFDKLSNTLAKIESIEQELRDSKLMVKQISDALNLNI
jgi:hypothetical protein